MSTPIDTSICNLIIDRVVGWLSANCIDGVSDELTKAGLVRYGRLQSDPTIHRINILVHRGGENWPDILKPRYHAIEGVPYEMGGGVEWIRRFRLEFEIFFVGLSNRSEAERRADVVASRFRYWLYRTPMNGLTDSFGETALDLEINDLVLREDGGPGTFVYRGEMRFGFITETPSRYA